MAIQWGNAIAAGIGVAGSLLGGSKGGHNRREKDLNEWIVNRQNYYSWREDNRAQEAQKANLWNQNWQRQQQTREYQQNLKQMYHGIRLKVEDAKRSGIHPLYALGQTPIQMGGAIAGAVPQGSVSGVSSPGQPAPSGQSKSGSLLQQGAQVAAAAYEAYQASVSQKAAQTAALLESSARTKLLQARAGAITDQQKDSSAAKTLNQKNISNKQENLYIPVYDQIAGQTIYMPNPALALEMPESVGAYYYGKGRALGPGGTKNTTPSPADSYQLAP